MSENDAPPWLAWAREIQAISQTGLTFSDSEYEIQRYQRLMEIAAEITARHATQPAATLLHDFQTQRGYATPKIDVRGAVVRDGKILLVQERADQRWCMPGGWADVGDAPSAMVVREVWEESGFEVQTRQVIGVYDANRSGDLTFYHAYKIVFYCEIVGGAARPSEETSAVDFFDFNQLPPLSFPRTGERHLADVLAFIRDPKRPTVFD